jgi:hypothetical protein
VKIRALDVAAGHFWVCADDAFGVLLGSSSPPTFNAVTVVVAALKKLPS